MFVSVFLRERCSQRRSVCVCLCVCLFAIHAVHFEEQQECDLDVQTRPPRAERQLPTYTCCLDVGGD